MKNKEHLTEDGKKKIVSIKANQNLGLPEKLQKLFLTLFLLLDFRLNIKQQKI